MKFNTEAYLASDNSYDDEIENEREEISEQIFEMCQTLAQQRPDLDEFESNFDISKTVKQMGEEQLMDSV